MVSRAKSVLPSSKVVLYVRGREGPIGQNTAAMLAVVPLIMFASGGGGNSVTPGPLLSSPDHGASRAWASQLSGLGLGAPIGPNPAVAAGAAPVDPPVDHGEGDGVPEADLYLVLLRHDPNGVQWLREMWEAVTDPGSPLFRQFLQPVDVLARLSPTAAQCNQAEAWLRIEGYTITKRYGDAFGVVRRRHAWTQRPNQLARPEAIQSIVSRLPTPDAAKLRRARRPSTTAKATPASAAKTIRALYSVPALASTRGVQVGIWQSGGCRVFPPDTSSFSNLSGLPHSGTLTSIPPVAPNATEACIEADLDVEALFTAADTVVAVSGVNNGTGFLPWAIEWFAEPAATAVEIMTVSWGSSEGSGSGPPPSNTSDQMRLNTEFMKLGAIGRAVFWAVGDGGSQGNCGHAIPGQNSSFACDNTTGFAPLWPATSPYVTACGGTELSVASPMDPTGAPPICRTSPAGCADGSHRTGRRAAKEQATSINVSAFSSGGGFSWWFPRPTYQHNGVDEYLRSQGHKGTLPPQHKWTQHGRGIPDVAALAGNLVILSNGEVWNGGGTSAAAPFWAGVWALATAVSQTTCGKPLGPANPLLYAIAKQQPHCFFDVIDGDNKCPWSVLWEGNHCDCTDCDGFEADRGWDPVTGLGSPNVSCILEAVAALPC
eukprot:m.425642 g.425642  ORF g.425642 m.425642 type:complete len:658 (+) comp53615_c0_seq1:69-2042(+)